MSWVAVSTPAQTCDLAPYSVLYKARPYKYINMDLRFVMTTLPLSFRNQEFNLMKLLNQLSASKEQRSLP